MRADTGPIGGDLSHEFIILAETGESEVFCHRDFLDFDGARRRTSTIDDATCAPIVEPVDRALRRDRRDARRGALRARGAGGQAASPRAASRSATSSTSAPNIPSRWARRCTGPDGEQVPVQMGSYGIGVVAPGRRHHRGQPRRGRHHLAGAGRAVRGRPDQPEGRRCRHATRPATSSMRELAGAGIDVLYDDTRRAGRREVRRPWT